METILPIFMGVISGLLLYGIIGFIFTRKTEFGRSFLIKTIIFGILFIIITVLNLIYFKK